MSHRKGFFYNNTIDQLIPFEDNYRSKPAPTFLQSVKDAIMPSVDDIDEEEFGDLKARFKDLSSGNGTGSGKPADDPEVSSAEAMIAVLAALNKTVTSQNDLLQKYYKRERFDGANLIHDRDLPKIPSLQPSVRPKLARCVVPCDM